MFKANSVSSSKLSPLVRHMDLPAFKALRSVETYQCSQMPHDNQIIDVGNRVQSDGKFREVFFSKVQCFIGIFPPFLILWCPLVFYSQITLDLEALAKASSKKIYKISKL